MSVNFISTLAQPLRTAAKFVAHQESASGLSTARFIQDTSTCLLPKAACARSKEDLAENSVQEIAESCLVYFAPALIGEKIARKAYSRNLSAEAKKLVSTSAVELLGKKGAVSHAAAALNKKVIPVKAAIALSALIIPLAEFTTNYIKNLFTLKVFKKADFNNIASLENSKENKESQNKVEKSAYKNIKRAIGVFAASLGLGVLIAKRGANSKTLQNVSEAILAPGTKFFKNNEKAKNFFNKYFSLDFASEKGKLVLSKGQLTACVTIGGLGYFGAAKDRGKQNFLETLFRFPLVGFYIITGSDLFEKGFKKMLVKAGKCKEIIGKDLKTPSFADLEKIAKNKDEFKKLAKKKVFVSGVPFLFSIGFMGFFVAASSNLFTKYRYNREMRLKAESDKFLLQKNNTKTFTTFFK